MKRLLLVLAILTSVITAQAPNFSISPVGILQPTGMFLNMTVEGPPMSQFTVYYVVGNIFYDPSPQIGVLYSGQTGQNGLHTNLIPVQSPVQFDLSEAQLAAVFFPPAAPPIPTEIVSLTLTGGGPPPPLPCGPAIGAMTYDAETCTIIARVKVCPGDLFEVKINGVVVGSGVGPTSGEVVVGLGGQCLPAGATLTGVVNGNDANPLLGPIRG